MMRVPAISKLLIISAIVFLVATLYVVGVYGRTVYFLAFHRPFPSLSLHTPTDTTTQSLPTFHVTAAIATANMAESIHITAVSDKNTSGFLEAWITGPDNKQVYRSTLNKQRPDQFLSGKSYTYTFRYSIASSLPKGTYRVSTLITSTTMQTDYYVHENFASFNVR